MGTMQIDARRLVRFGGQAVHGTVTIGARRGVLVLTRITGYPPAMTITRKERVRKTIESDQPAKTKSVMRITPIAKSNIFQRAFRRIGSVIRRAASF